MAAKKRTGTGIPIKDLHRQLKKYNQTVLRKAYTGLKDVGNLAVSRVKLAVEQAPPTHVSSGPSKPQRKSKYGTWSTVTGKSGAVATGRYRDAWRAKRMKQGMRMGVLIFNTTVHAPRVEYGRLPGKMPPVQAIRKWLQAKFGLPYRRARRLAWPVAKRIAQRGIPGRRILTNPNTELDLNLYMEEAISKAQLAAARQVFP